MNLKIFLLGLGFIGNIIFTVLLTERAVKREISKQQESGEVKSCQLVQIFEGREIPLISVDGQKKMVKVPTEACWSCSGKITCREINAQVEEQAKD